MKKNWKRLMLCLLVSCLLASTCSAFAASKSGGITNKKAVIGLTDYGWTTFNISARMTETYSTSGSKVTYTVHNAYVDVTASRKDSGIGLSIAPVPRHYNKSTNKTVKSLTMKNYAVILPGNVYQYYAKKSTQSVTYAKKNNNVSGFGMALFKTGCINPYGTTISVNLAVS